MASLPPGEEPAAVVAAPGDNAQVKPEAVSDHTATSMITTADGSAGSDEKAASLSSIDATKSALSFQQAIEDGGKVISRCDACLLCASSYHVVA